MLTKSLFTGATLGLLLSSAVAHDAPVVKDNEPQAVYEAVLQDKDNTTVRGTFTTHGAEDGIGIQFRVVLTGVPKDTFLSGYILAVDSLITKLTRVKRRLSHSRQAGAERWQLLCHRWSPRPLHAR